MREIKHILHKTTTMENNEYGIRLNVTRTRTSTGMCAIVIEVGSSRLTITNNGELKESYAIAVRELAEMLLTIVEDPCELPDATTTRKIKLTNADIPGGDEDNIYY